MDNAVSGISELEAIITDLTEVAESYTKDIELQVCPGLIKYGRELTFCVARLDKLIHYIAQIAINADTACGNIGALTKPAERV